MRPVPANQKDNGCKKESGVVPARSIDGGSKKIGRFQQIKKTVVAKKKWGVVPAKSKRRWSQKTCKLGAVPAK